MKLRFADLWRWEGTIDRGPYLLIGVLGFAIKHNLDRLIATTVFHRSWGILDYLQPGMAPGGKLFHLLAVSGQDAVFFGTLVAVALPFIWVGVVLTIKRLRAVRLPLWLMFLFFVPVVNLCFFALLSLLPSRPAGHPGAMPRRKGLKRFFDRVIPDDPTGLGSATLAVGVILLFGLGAIFLGAQLLKQYGWGLFVGLPFSLGLIAALLYGYHRPRSLGRSLLVAILAIVLLGVLIFATAMEGLICLAMAFPLAVGLAMMGALVGYYLQRRPGAMQDTPATFLLLVLMTPSMMGLERGAPHEPPLIAVRTAVEVNVPPEAVWRHLIAFAELPPPREWLFRLGIAYPVRAEIMGEGAGAVRHCVFSTGSFVEPIEVWDAPRLLRFSVTSNPPPMAEWTPYANIHPPHLNGFLVSKRGQFFLTPLPNGTTRLEGTTWYQHNMWPAGYWQLWSDYMIHRIHRRVLNHIKAETEGLFAVSPELDEHSSASQRR